MKRKPPVTGVVCPRCDSEAVFRAGTRYTKTGKKQIYLCKVCSRIFPNQYTGKHTSPPKECVHCKSTNTRKAGFQRGIQLRHCNTCDTQFRDAYQRDPNKVTVGIAHEIKFGW